MAPSSERHAYPLRSFAAGAAAGALDTCVTMPLDTIKTQMQIRAHRSVYSCAEKIIAADGLKGLYYGFPPFLLQASGKAAVRFCMYDVLVKLVDTAGVQRERKPALWSGLCGLGAGMAEALFWTAPTERLKVLRQARAGEGKTCTPPSVFSIVTQRGLGDLYVGAGATAARQASSVAMRFCFLDGAKSQICTRMGYEKKSAPSWVTFLSGGIGGCLSAVLNNPIDVVKSRIQAGNGSLGIVGALREVIAERGITVLAAGLQARATRLFLSQAIQFTVVEKLIKLCT